MLGDKGFDRWSSKLKAVGALARWAECFGFSNLSKSFWRREPKSRHADRRRQVSLTQFTRLMKTIVVQGAAGSNPLRLFWDQLNRSWRSNVWQTQRGLCSTKSLPFKRQVKSSNPLSAADKNWQTWAVRFRQYINKKGRLRGLKGALGLPRSTVLWGVDKESAGTSRKSNLVVFWDYSKEVIQLLITYYSLKK